MVESTVNIDTELQYLLSELEQRINDEDYLKKCTSLIGNRFDEKKWGASELRKIEVLLEGAITDKDIKKRVGNVFGDIEENPPSDLIKKACTENMHRAGGKLLDRSMYTPN